MIVIKCARCNQQINLDPSLAGDTVNCPHCGNANRAPENSGFFAKRRARLDAKSQRAEEIEKGAQLHADSGYCIYKVKEHHETWSKPHMFDFGGVARHQSENLAMHADRALAKWLAFIADYRFDHWTEGDQRKLTRRSDEILRDKYKLVRR